MTARLEAGITAPPVTVNTFEITHLYFIPEFSNLKLLVLNLLML